MLQNRIDSLRTTIWIILGGFIPVWIGISYYAWEDSNVSLVFKILFSIVIGILALAYFVVRYLLELQVAVNYLSALQNRQFAEALTLGRSYYGLRRSGLRGLAGSNNFIDEQSITNDIAAYSST